MSLIEGTFPTDGSRLEEQPNRFSMTAVFCVEDIGVDTQPAGRSQAQQATRRNVLLDFHGRSRILTCRGDLGARNEAEWKGRGHVKHHYFITKIQPRIFGRSPNMPMN